MFYLLLNNFFIEYILIEGENMLETHCKTCNEVFPGC